MERVAREAREFREAEAKRIATEKEEVRQAAELQKQIERERIALESGRFLKDAVKEREAMARLKALMSQQQKEQNLKSGIDVSGTAKQFSEMEDLERKRKEERRMLKELGLRIASSRDSVDSASLESLSGEAEEFEELRGSAPAISRQASLYYDAAMSQSSLEKDTPRSTFSKQASVYFDATMSQSTLEKDAVTAPLKHQETIYYDTNDTLSAEESSTPASKLDSSAVFQTPWQDAIPKEEESKETVYFDARATSSMTPYQNPGQGSTETSDSGASVGANFQTPRDVLRGERSSKNTSYYVSELEDATSPAGVQARALFSAKGDVGGPSEVELDLVDPNAQESIMTRQPRRVPRKVKKTDIRSDEELLAHNRIQEACYEIPIEYNSSDGTFTVTRDADLSMSTSMAPSRVDGRWSGVLEGKASLGPSALVNSAFGSVGLDYAVNSWSKLSLGMIRGHELYHPLIMIGGSLLRQGSVLGVTFYHNASFLHAMLLEHSMYSISFRHLFPNTRWIFSSELSRRQEFSLAISNTKLSSRVNCSLRNPKLVSARLDLRPRINESRIAHIFWEWKSVGSWQVGGSLIQSLHSRIATVGLGIRLFSARGLEWVLSWTRGEATVRIPVVVASGVRNVHPIQVLYFSLISFLIQEGIAELWGWNNPVIKGEEEGSTKTLAAIATTKARQDAELQKALMARQAKRKKREEAEKEGLIIHRATYSVEGGEEWDAAIPLQFWVNRSSLTLPAKSKSQLLGFYDISTKNAEKEPDMAEDTHPSIGSVLWWKAIWLDLLDRTTDPSPLENDSSGPSPTLEIRYDFQGQSYRITIQDKQELILPHPRAERL